jgi:ectoine hydroxylase-related dioxygenase (phytanoyl-CoA dioxygenase family)
MFDHRFSSDGFVVVEDALDAARLRALRSEVDRVAEAERRSGTAWFSNGNQRIFMLLNKGQIFKSLITLDPMFSLVKRYLGEDCLLSSITANIAQPLNRAQTYHTDQQYVGTVCPARLTVNVVVMLDAFTDENGATVILKGSHLRAQEPSTDALAVSMQGRAGDAGLMDGRLWHGTGVNLTKYENRRAIFIYYCRPFMRQQENFARSLHPSVRHTLDAEERRLLGFDIWNGLGAVDGLPRDWQDGRPRIGPTNADALFDDRNDPAWDMS